MSAKIIDVHTHLVSPAYRAALEKNGKLFEDGFPCPGWDAQAHLAFMEQAGIGTGILSVSSPHQMVGTPAEGLALTKQLNDYMAQLQHSAPDAFRFAACLPLPLVEESVSEACRALDELGAVAVKFPTNADGLYPGDERLAPLMDVLDARSAVVLLHPCKPPAYPTDCFTAGPLPLLEFLGDTTRAVINLITQGAAERWKNVRYVVPHMGSFLPPLIDRLTGITALLSSKGIGKAVDARKALENFYFDLAGDAPETCLPSLLQITTPERLLFGGDYPYTPAPFVSQKIERLRAYAPLQPHLDGIFSENARKLFGL